MSWSIIIAEVFKMLGPFLGELFKKLLENLFAKVAKKLPAPTGDKAKDSLRLLEAARESTKRPLVRLFLARLADHVAKNGLVKPEGEARKELKALGAVAN